MPNVNILSKDLRNTVKKEVDFIPGAYVEFFDDITVGVFRKAQESLENKNIQGSLDIILTQIADWNFADEKEEKLPINIESLEKLPTKILVWLSNAQAEILNDIQSKKKE